MRTTPTRRRASVAAFGVATGLVALVGFGCGPRRGTGSGGGEGDGSSSMTDGETATSTTAPWVSSPEAWLGTYYWAHHGAFGELVTTPVPTRFPRLELRDDGTCILEMMHCADPDEPEWTSTFECTVHDDHVRMHNYEGSRIYNAHVVAIDWRFGPECGMLTEHHLTAAGAYGPMTIPWMRGRICVSDPCDPAVTDDPLLRSPWTYDLCPDEPTGCPCLHDDGPCP